MCYKIAKIIGKIISYSSIFISGSINFLFYEYYSCFDIDYISISGFVSFAQVIFRLIEKVLPFDEDYFYWIQSLFSFLGIIVSYAYLRCFCNYN